MSHGVMGMGPYAWSFLAATVGFLGFLSTSFKGPDKPKYYVPKEFADFCKENGQPGITPEHYYMPGKDKF